MTHFLRRLYICSVKPTTEAGSHMREYDKKAYLHFKSEQCIVILLHTSRTDAATHHTMKRHWNIYLADSNAKEENACPGQSQAQAFLHAALPALSCWTMMNQETVEAPKFRLRQIFDTEKNVPGPLNPGPSSLATLPLGINRK
jgi:hypothetical protein